MLNFFISLILLFQFVIVIICIYRYKYLKKAKLKYWGNFLIFQLFANIFRLIVYQKFQHIFVEHTIITAFTILIELLQVAVFLHIYREEKLFKSKVIWLIGVFLFVSYAIELNYKMSFQNNTVLIKSLIFAPLFKKIVFVFLFVIYFKRIINNQVFLNLFSVPLFYILFATLMDEIFSAISALGNANNLSSLAKQFVAYLYMIINFIVSVFYIIGLWKTKAWEENNRFKYDF